ncbi:MAG TPA: DUF3800 domain-containing protein [Syntrophobacteraceae bacterium]|nr:DUF3800 domain-containing protein [Syntrophobacteraceae bacterium]
MYIFYVDESGSPQGHEVPLKDGQTPIFVLACLAFQSERWRTLDRAYRNLKAKLFQDELRGRRPEQHEIKGTDLISPHNRTSKRRHAFAKNLFPLCQANQARGFAVIVKKSATQPLSQTSMYTMALQYLVERFQCFLDETNKGMTVGLATSDCNGVIIADSRLNNLDLNVAISHSSFIFGHSIGQKCTRIVEAPTFTFSQLSVGLQLTDIFAAYTYARAYRRHCHGIAGGKDYSHLDYFGEFADRMEFWSEAAYNGHKVRGCRFIDLSENV